MRRRIMNYGPSIRTSRQGRNRRVAVSTVSQSPRRGVILRNPPSFGKDTTTKSRLGGAEIRGIRSPGFRARNYTRAITW